MTRFIPRPATPEDSQELVELFRMAPMDGAISVATEREPDFFAGTNVQHEDAEVYLGQDQESGKLVGVFSIGKRRVFVNGEVRPLRYFCDLRIHKDFRQGTLLSRGFRFIKDNVMNGDEFAQTIIVADNKKAIQYLGSGRAGLPFYYPAGDYLTHAVSLRQKRRKRGASRDLSIRRAKFTDLPQIEELFAREAPKKQFYPFYDLKALRPENTTAPIRQYYRDLKLSEIFLAFRQEELLGLAGVWDQKAYKQTRIVAYAFWMNALRPLLNRMSFLSKGFYLPPAGSLLSYFSLHTILIKDNNSEVFQAILEEIFSEYQGGVYDYFLVGLDGDDPLNAALESFQRRFFRGKHFLISYAPTDPGLKLERYPYYLEVSRI